MSRIVPILSWLVTAWIANVFLTSLPYKFSKHPDTEHIFTTIGQWISAEISLGLGNQFSLYGAYIIGAAELITAIILLLPAFWLLVNFMGLSSTTVKRARYHYFGGLMASVLMAGAVFFHLFTPLGIEVIHQGQSDGGALFYAATSILVLGMVIAWANYRLLPRSHFS